MELYKIEHGLGSFSTRQNAGKKKARKRPPEVPELALLPHPPVSARKQASGERRRKGSSASSSRGSNGGDVATPTVAEGVESHRQQVGAADRKRPAAEKKKQRVPKGGAAEQPRHSRWGGGPHQSAEEKARRLSKVHTALPPPIHTPVRPFKSAFHVFIFHGFMVTELFWVLGMLYGRHYAISSPRASHSSGRQSTAGASSTPPSVPVTHRLRFSRWPFGVIGLD